MTEMYRGVPMEGSLVRITPYVHHERMPQDAFYGLWRQARDEKLLDRILYWMEKPKRYALEAFCAYLALRPLVISVMKETGQLAGFSWLDDVGYLPLRASMSICYFKAGLGAPAHEASLLTTGWYFVTTEARRLYGMTPWKSAARHALECGWTYHTTLPQWVLKDGHGMDVHVVWIDNPLRTGDE